MKAYNIQRTILFAGVLPLSIVTFVWNIIRVLSFFMDVDITDGLRKNAGGNLGTGESYGMRHGSGSRFPQIGWKRAYYDSSGNRLPSGSVGGLQDLNTEGAIAAAVFASVLPTFLVMFLSVAVFLWLLVIAFSSPTSAQCSLRSETRTLAVFTWLGLALMLWQLLGFFIPVGILAAHVPVLFVSTFMALLFVWGFLLWLALCMAWVYESRWAKKNAQGQTQQSMQTLIAQEAALDFNDYAGNKEWDSDNERPSYNTYRTPYDTTLGTSETEITPFQYDGPSVATDPKARQVPGSAASAAPAPTATSPTERKGQYKRVHNP